MSSIINARSRRTVRLAALASLVALPALVLAVAATRGVASAQPAGSTSERDGSALHMVMTPTRPRTLVDSVRAAGVAAALRAAIDKYRDTTAAVADGFRMFAPQIRNQKVYHFTRGWNAVQEAFRFDASKPTSLLYTKGADGTFTLVGGMYTAPKRFTLDQLDERIPLSVARWHKHVNWCIPPRGARERWLERRDGQPVFGPESPIATKSACDAVGGVFHESLLGWMVHANVMTSSDPTAIWGDEHAGHDMQDGMKHDAHEE